MSNFSQQLLHALSPMRLASVISNLGNKHTNQRGLQSQTRVVNRLAATTCVAATLVTPLLFFIGAPQLGILIVFSIIPLMSIPLIFNAYGMFTKAKVAHLSIANAIVLGLSCCFGQEAHYQYFFFVLVGVPLIFFPNSNKSLKWIFSTIAVINWILVEIHFSHFSPLIILNTFEQDVFRFISNSLQFMFIAVMFYFFASESEKHYKELELKQTRLKASNLKLDEALEKAQSATRAKSMFLANMSHEIRTPLNGIIVASELVKNSELSPQQKELISIVKNSGTSLLSIVNNILDLSKAEANKLELQESCFDLHQLIASTTHSSEFLLKAKSVQIQTEIATEVNQYYLGDQQKLQQVLTNLLGNAIKFCDEGEIHLKVAHLSSATNHRAQLQFTIEDSGIGIAPEKLNQIFESFTQEDGSISRTYGGTGLGTTISKMLVELMGGNISAISPNPNNTINSARGSIFTFTVDLGCIEASEHFNPSFIESISEEEDESYSDLDFNGLSVLLAEDNIINQKVAEHLFKNIGCELDVASDGKEALQKSLENSYDLIFMDQMMPVMDGLTATKEIRKNGISIPIIAMSANVLEEDRIACLDAGMNDYISKPVMRKELITMMEKWVNRA